MPWIHRLDWQDGGTRTTTPEIQGYPSLQVCRTDLPRSRPRSNQWDWHDSRDGRRHPKDAPGRPNMRGRYARPDHNRRAWNPDIICAACKRRGHPASNCDMLAMALFLVKYMKSSITPADRDKIESAWLMRWKERLGNPSRLPRKVMRMYLEDMDITSDDLDAQMDWECWPTMDEIEDFGYTEDTAVDV